EGVNHIALNKIFEPFYRSEEVRSKNIQGAGLGLSVVKSIVDYHKGMLTVQSIPHESTTFLIELPVD
ncbi:MAG: sensor histidine kinase, partial [Ignavibacteria bacterium]|nr:sensor histidine kinase [Ignavibacteria bacterium]